MILGDFNSDIADAPELASWVEQHRLLGCRFHASLYASGAGLAHLPSAWVQVRHQARLCPP
eukprot:11288307-Alexandrium_andersonii.AAC.1